MAPPRRFRKLHPRHAGIVMPFFLSILMTCVVSAIATVRLLGFSHEALVRWPESWALSWVLAFPTLLLVLPVVRWLTARIVDLPEPKPRDQSGTSAQ